MGKLLDTKSKFWMKWMDVIIGFVCCAFIVFGILYLIHDIKSDEVESDLSIDCKAITQMKEMSVETGINNMNVHNYIALAKTAER